MKNTTTLIYDGSFNGFLTAIFIAFDEKFTIADIQKNNQSQNGLFSDTETIFTNVDKALTKDDIYFANVEPDFDVLPLISKHFRNRYADQQWLIYDVKRRYGIFYNIERVEIISLDLSEIHFNRTRKSKTFTENEYEYQELWNNYFQSTNIKSRINRKLHTQHVPKRYWKYLSEKKEAPRKKYIGIY